MTLPFSFVYSTQPHLRKHHPAGYTNYEEYKPWLRDEFTFRCVYCLERENWYPDRAASFSTDHIVPRNEDPSRICDYENLVYACTRCNSLKRQVLLLDPTASALNGHLLVAEDGGIRALSREGELLIRLLHLNEDPALGVRRYHLAILSLKQEFPDNLKVHQLFLHSFAYPDDLPDLAALRPPGGNSLKKNIATCYYARRQKSELEETY